MQIKQLVCSFAVSIWLTANAASASEMIMVDKAEYEELRAAVKYLMEERQKQQVAVEEAKQTADEAVEVAEAAAEAAESSSLGKFENLSLGGYVEAHYNNYDYNDGNEKKEFDLHRFVLFTGYEYNDKLRFFSEMEIEHGGVQDTADGDGALGGEVEVEQAYIEYDFVNNASARAGLFILPIGMLNETHEPDTFYGVERNSVEKYIVPTTWWEIGSMVTFNMDNGLKFEGAVHSGLNMSNDDGDVRGGRQKGSNAEAENLAYTFAATYTGMQGLELGVSYHYEDDPSQQDGDGGYIEEGSLIEAHIAYNSGMFSLKALYAEWDFEGDGIEADNGDEQKGWYIEPSIRPIPNLGFFARYEDLEYFKGSEKNVEIMSVGANYYLHEQVALKADYIDYKDNVESSKDFDGFNLGVGLSF